MTDNDLSDSTLCANGNMLIRGLQDEKRLSSAQFGYVLVDRCRFPLQVFREKLKPWFENWGIEGIQYSVSGCPGKVEPYFSSAAIRASSNSIRRCWALMDSMSTGTISE